MKFITLCILALWLTQDVYAQLPGDTVVVSTFNYSQTYGSGNRDTMIHFPDAPGLNFEKIYMLYNMRCKNGVVGSQVPPSGTSGCGEWDYSCNTYITDSSKTDSTKATHPSHIISGFSGTTYNYTTQPTFTYYKYNQKSVVHNSTISETSATVGNGNTTLVYPFNTTQRCAKSFFLWTATELSAAGLSAGNISSIKLNISNAGSQAQFLKIRMKHSSAIQLSAASPELSGFTEVYFLNTSFANGLNELNFYNNFSWNGVDNILVEFSFTNAATGTDNQLSADLSAVPMGLVSNNTDYNYEFTGANKIQLGNNNFSNFSNEISIAFWAYGNPGILPTNTSVAYATNSQGHRQVNIHLPWSNSNMYWDCGSGGSYDRINKLANNSDIEGQWNHWVFTKNATSGVMNMYLNGVLWSTGTGKTLPVVITDFMLGEAPGNSNPYFGKIDDFSLWNTELTAADVAAWMYKKIDATHPKYNNLIAYYQLNEGSGNTSLDASVAAQSATISGTAKWNLTKGIDMFKAFSEISTRPQITFVQGVYNQTTATIVVMDSTQNAANTVNAYAVNNNNIVLNTSNNYYQSGYMYTYDGDTNALLDSVNVAATGTINITQLNYFQFSPSRFQIMSFVTPYGNGLDLGLNGKTWTFDVSDFAPILKGWKRMTMDAGGQWQEDMDIKFLFIVGTPPRDIKDINQLWKVESVGYTNILNNAKFEPRDVKLNSNASAFKIKTAITGHGQEGEFIPRQHYINLNGGSKEYVWDVWKPCASNPVYPQGGTWIYDRAGWCPGMATDIVEQELPSTYTPGSMVQFDYGLDTATGSSNYWVSSQLVEYGPANHSLDAAVTDILSPTDKVEYARTNSICNNPTIEVQNTGSTAISSIQFAFWVNGSTSPELYTWSGNLTYLQKSKIVLPSTALLWQTLNPTGPNNFYVEIKEVNGIKDNYEFNDSRSSAFVIPPVVPADFIVYFKTNNVPAENEYKIIDENGNVVFSKSGQVLNANTIYRDTLRLPLGCYKLEMTDLGEDGINFWANPNAGQGVFRFTKNTGQILKTFNPDFGKSIIYNFTVDYPLSYEELNAANHELSIFPNPAKTSFTVEMQGIDKAQVVIYNQTGQAIQLKAQKSKHAQTLDCTNLSRGIYFVEVIEENGKKIVRKVLID